MHDLSRYAPEKYEISCTEIKSFHGGWGHRLLVGMFCFGLVVVAFYCGRYAQKRKPNSPRWLSGSVPYCQKLKYQSAAYRTAVT